MEIKAVWLDGTLVGNGDATVSVGSLGLHYGIGFFEGIRCYETPAGPAIFRLTDHLRRLARSAAVYGVTLPYTPASLAQACMDVVRANGLANCYLRPIAFMGESQSADPLDAKFRVAVIASQHAPLVSAGDGRGATAKISSFHRLPPNVIPPAAKATGQYLNSFLAQTEARQCGADHAILLSADGRVTDGWAQNLFAVLDGTLVTPPISTGSLPGTTRDSLLTLAKEVGYEVREADLVRADLYLADECMLTGTAAGVIPIVSVDGRHVGDGSPGPITAKLTELLADAVHGRADTHTDWRTLVA
jgi:branched-chain amino acid aminotransferase